MSQEKKEKLTKAEKIQAKEDKKFEKLEKKYELAYEKRDALQAKIDELQAKVETESDQKKKAELRKTRDALIDQRNSIVITESTVKIPMEPKKKKLVQACVAIILIVALLCAYVGTGFVRKGLTSTLGLTQNVITAYTIKDGEGDSHSVKVSTYNYYFAMVYNNLQQTASSYKQYGINLDDVNMNVDFDQKLSKQTRTTDDGTQTWLEYVQEQVMDQIKSNYMWYYEALKANDGKEPKITEDQQKEIDEAIDSYKTTATSYGLTVSAYLQYAMGKGVTENVFRKEAKISYIATNYQEEYSDELASKEYTDDELNAYKKDNLASLQSVDVKMFECDTEDEAKAFKKALKADGSNFAALASKYSSDSFDKAANKNAVETTYVGMTRGTLESSSNFAIGTVAKHEHSEDEKEDAHSYPGLDWLYSKSRKAGDIKQDSTTVVYVVKPVYLSTVHPVTIRHILVAPVSAKDTEDSESTTAAKDCTAAEWKTAYKKAQSILKDYKAGKKTADSFGALAKENSTDGNANDGGIYENVVPNQMVPTFNAWCFDSARKAGDTAIVKTQFGYHVMYFESKSDMTVWQYTAQQALASEDGTDTKDKLEKGYTIKKSWFGSRYFEIDTDIDS